AFATANRPRERSHCSLAILPRHASPDTLCKRRCRARASRRDGEGRGDDVTLAQVVKQVPDSRLSEHPLVTTDAAERVRHARGQSLGDWIALRSGQVETFPDGVAYPQHAEDVAAL